MRKSTQLGKRGAGPGDLEALARAGRNRLIAMSVAFVLVLSVFVGGLYLGSVREGEEQGQLPGERIREEVVVPVLQPAELEELVRDARPADRALADTEGLNLIVDFARLLTPAHFDRMDVRTLDAETWAAVMEDPQAARTDAFLARGWIVDLDVRSRRPSAPAEHRGTLRTEDGRHVHFVTLANPHELAAGDYAGVTGLFFKLYSREDPEEAGTWLEGPTLVGPRIVRSWPAVEMPDAPPDVFLGAVEDDTSTSLTGLPDREYWKLMTWVAEGGGEAVDWESVPEFDNEVMTEVLLDGDRYRGQPFRIPISQNMDTWTVAAGENPARLERVTYGWIGNWTWLNAAGVVHFRAPFVRPELETTKLVQGRGYFLKNWAYEPLNGGVRIAPLFVLASLEPVVPPYDPTVDYILYGVAGTTVLLVALLVWLLARDKRKSAALHEELVRRRRARRGRDSGEAAPEPPPA